MENYNKNGMAAGVHTDAAKTNNTVNVKGAPPCRICTVF